MEGKRGRGTTGGPAPHCPVLRVVLTQSVASCLLAATAAVAADEHGGQNDRAGGGSDSSRRRRATRGAAVAPARDERGAQAPEVYRVLSLCFVDRFGLGGANSPIDSDRIDD